MKKSKEVLYLKILLAVYIIMCLIIAGLNYGFAPSADEKTAHLINQIWHFYENEFKFGLIIVGSILTLRIAKQKQSSMYQRNIIALITSAACVHIIGPFLLNNKELYFYTMPLPWTTLPVQLLDSTSSFYQSTNLIYGLDGIKWILIFFSMVTIIVLIGSLLLGRRFQCSMVCMFNGFVSEVFRSAFPIIGKKKKLNNKTKQILAIIRWLFLILGLSLVMVWTLDLNGFNIPNIEIIALIENYKYLTTELMMAMFFWVVFTGRGYCFYCPLGTVVAIIGKLVGQQINTTKTNCVNCRQCDQVCPMQIDISSQAIIKQPVKDFNCVGCGHCVDVCPTRTLKYQTHFLKKISKR